MLENVLLTTEEMARADKAAVAAGVASLTLMENAGQAVADVAWRHLQPGHRVVVLCGPGNNGGDGFVAARHLTERGCIVEVGLLGEASALTGDAAEMMRRWHGPTAAAADVDLTDAALVIDALFGAGLTRPLDGVASEIVGKINARAAQGVRVLSVDVPSGLDGSIGKAAGPVVRATQTVTFFRKKPGHVLLPGRGICGHVITADIGIPAEVLTAIAPQATANVPEQWIGKFPWRRLEDHKYDHGHAVVVSGPAFQSGAARMAARGALRIGAGLVTIASPPSALPENAVHLTAIMLTACASGRVLADILGDRRKNTVVIGPAAGFGEETAELTLAALASDAAVVLDADALMSFAEMGHVRDGSVGFGFTAKEATKARGAATLFDAIRGRGSRPVVLTPHEGEFGRLFPELAGLASKLERARAAAQQSGATVVLKGGDTVIATPEGVAAINDNAPPWLATAGAGDVLAGFVAGLVAQHMPVFDAACAAVWLHGACARAAGPGMIAEDLSNALPGVLDSLHLALGRPGWDPDFSNGGVG